MVSVVAEPLSSGCGPAVRNDLSTGRDATGDAFCAKSTSRQAKSARIALAHNRDRRTRIASAVDGEDS